MCVCVYEGKEVSEISQMRVTVGEQMITNVVAKMVTIEDDGSDHGPPQLVVDNTYLTIDEPNGPPPTLTERRLLPNFKNNTKYFRTRLDGVDCK